MLTDEVIARRLRDAAERIHVAVEPEPVDYPTTDLWVARTPQQSPTRRRPQLAAIAACVALAVGVGGLYVAAQRQTESPVSDAPAAAPGPRWLDVLTTYVPAEFEHIVVMHSHQDYVNFGALDLDTSKQLHITVSRGAMGPDPSRAPVALEDARTATWTDPNAEYNVSLPDGRQIGVYCSFPPVPDDQPNCPVIDGVATDAEDLRSLVLALADHMPATDLPPASDTLPHVDADAIRAAVAAVTTREEVANVEAPHYASSLVQYNYDTSASDSLRVFTLTGLTPIPDPATPRRTATLNGWQATWQVMPDHSVWFVYDGPDAGQDLPDRILDAAQAQYASD